MTKSLVRFGLIGQEGRMGQALALAIEAEGHTLQGGIGAGGEPQTIAGECDVLVDFSVPAALERNVEAAIAAKVPILVGTTGLGSRHFDLLLEAEKQIPVLQTGNTSLGVTLMRHLVREATRRLSIEWDVEVLEMHHRDKVDAPSGTALLLGEAAAEGRGVKLSESLEIARGGKSGPRQSGTIGFASLRGGTVSGEHSVILAGDEERIMLSHSAENRNVFAKGAVKAGIWLVGKTPGRYTMAQVLDL